MRKILVSEFMGPKRAKLFNLVLVTEMETVIRSLSEHPSNDAVNLNGLFFALVKRVVCKVAFGKNCRKEPLSSPSWEVMLNEALELLSDSLQILMHTSTQLLMNIAIITLKK